MPPLVPSKVSPMGALWLTLLHFKKVDMVETESKDGAPLVLKFNALGPEVRQKILESVARCLITLGKDISLL